MFRESDHVDIKLHPTYSNKPKSIIQELTQAAKFDGVGLSSLDYQQKSAVSIPAVPTTWDTQYDPNNSEADWAGLVSRSNHHRRHTTNHVSQQIGVLHTEYGIVSKSEKQEWAHKRYPKMDKNTGTDVIGGISQTDDRWNTTYKSFAANEVTSREQLTLDKRSRPIQVRNIVDQKPKSLNHINESNAVVTGSNNTRPFSQRSMLSSLGSDLVTRIHEQPPNSCGIGVIVKKEPDVLLTQNYNPFPGYTGHRSK